MKVNNTNPKVSVISIAIKQEEFDVLLRILADQTYRNYEFIGEAGGTIPEAWNRAIARARGEVLVFTETDAVPVDEHWLEELVSSIPDERTVIKGLEVTGLPLDLSNMAAHRSVFEGQRFDESFRWSEDTELFCRLEKAGVQFVQIERAPVIHLRKTTKKRYIQRAFSYGLYWAKLRHQYPGCEVEISGFGEIVKMLIKYALNLAGLLIGTIIYFPLRFRNERER